LKTHYNSRMLRINLRCVMISLLGCSMLATACTPHRSLSPPPASNFGWSYRDLRALDAADAPQPSQDVLAAYVRTDEDELHIRLDLLDLPELPDFDLYLALDADPGGSRALPIDAYASLAWDILLAIPARGSLQVLRDMFSGEIAPLPKTGLRVQRDPRQDTMTISLDKAALGKGFLDSQAIPGMGVEIFVTPAGSKSLTDHLAPFYLNAPPPLPARALLVFWNAFPAYTPLQALRRWDGAHTGPFGGRHGLGNLLRAAQSSASPLFLLDLNQPVGLSTLDAVGGLEIAQSMAADGLLGLPSALPGFPSGAETPGILRPPAWARQRAAEENLRSEADFGLSSSPYFFSPAGLAGLPSLTSAFPIRSKGIAFIPQDESQLKGDFVESLAPIRAEYWNGWMVLPVPAYGLANLQPEQAAVDGPTLLVRRALIEAALASQRGTGSGNPILVLGGDLPASAWGNPQIARAAFRYLQNHPWIHLLTPGDLALEQPTLELNTDLASSGTDLNGAEATLLEALRSAPDNAPGAAAWQAYRAAFAPVSPSSSGLMALRATYARQIGSLLEAAHWAAAPHDEASCDHDPDLDGQPECILTSQSVFAEFELDQGGYLAYLMVLDEAGEVHQLIAPSALLISGTSPADTWNLISPALADPQALPGAFLEMDPPIQARAQVEMQTDGLHMVLPGNSLVKTFHLLPNGLNVEVTGVAPGEGYHASVALTFDPWLRYLPGWSQHFISYLSGQRWVWGDPTGSSIEIQTDATIRPAASTDHPERLVLPENPNQDAPAGYRLPFPLAEGRLAAEKDFSTTIRLVR
jgi:hypothetical protein